MQTEIDELRVESDQVQATFMLEAEIVLMSVLIHCTSLQAQRPLPAGKSVGDCNLTADT